MGLIYAISVLVFVCVIASVYSNEVTRPYLTTKVVVFTGIRLDSLCQCYSSNRLYSAENN